MCEHDYVRIAKSIYVHRQRDTRRALTQCTYVFMYTCKYVYTQVHTHAYDHYLPFQVGISPYKTHNLFRSSPHLKMENHVDVNFGIKVPKYKFV